MPVDVAVSVSITTYNHARYIAKAVESALSQKTSFPFEILIGEDDSQDGTRQIVQDLADHFPDRIRLFLNDRKNVIYVNGRPTGRWNFINNIKQARGRYIALLEGDDYWTLPDKLQKQVDFLNSHPDYSMSFHQVEIIEEGRQPRLHCPKDQPATTSLADLLIRNYLPSCSVLFRAGLFSEFPDWYFRTPMGDWPLHILNAQHGKIGYLDECMGAYRIHPGGTWSSLGTERNIREIIAIYDYFTAHLGRLHRTARRRGVSRWHAELAFWYALQGERRKAVLASLKSFRWALYNPYVRQRRLVGLLLVACLPGFDRLWTGT